MIRWNGRPSKPTRLTPRPLIEALGGADSFDLDPCAAPEPRPWPTARQMISLPTDGLALRWHGRLFLNPPYGKGEIRRWLARMAEHGRGVALINATTESSAFARYVWESASGLLFLEGRLIFCDEAGEPIRNKHGRPNGNPSPSVLCAYGQDDLDHLMACDLGGARVPLRFARFLLVAGLDRSWSQIIGPWLRAQSGPVSLAEAYSYFSRHPKTHRNSNWRAKVRQKMRQHGERVGPAVYRARLI